MKCLRYSLPHTINDIIKNKNTHSLHDFICYINIICLLNNYSDMYFIKLLYMSTESINTI